jgi:hypothetical protein
MSREKPKTFSSAREVFKTYLPRTSKQAILNSGYGQVEDTRTSKLLQDFKSSLKRQARR